MPTIDVQYARAASTSVPSGGAYTQACAIAAGSFITGRDYLVIGRCAMSFSSSYMKMTLRKGLYEAYPGHVVEQTASRSGNGVEEFGAMSKWTADGTSNWNIVAANYGGSAVTLYDASILGIDLTTFGSANYWWNENTTLMSSMDNVYANHIGATVTWTATGTDSYLIIASADGDHNGDDGYYFRSMLYDSTDSAYLNDPVVRPGAIGDFNTYKCNLHMYVITPSAGSHTLQMRFGGDSRWHHRRSNMIVIRLKRFMSWASSATRPNAAYTKDTETSIGSFSFTPAASNGTVVLGRLSAQTTSWDFHLNQALKIDATRVQDVVGAGGSWNGIVPSSGHTGGGIDEAVWGQFYDPSLAASAHTIDQLFYPHADSGDGSTILVRDRALVAFSRDVGIVIDGTTGGAGGLDTSQVGVLRGEIGSSNAEAEASAEPWVTRDVGGGFGGVGGTSGGAGLIKQGAGGFAGSTDLTGTGNLLRAVSGDLVGLSSTEGDALRILGLRGNINPISTMSGKAVFFMQGQPVPHHVWNEFDYHGITLGLTRLELEHNPEFKRRLLDVMVHRANSTYMGLIYGITRELGLKLQKAIRITMDLNSNGNPILPCPAVVFQDTNVLVYDDYFADSLVGSFDRWNAGDRAYTLEEVVAKINELDHFHATLDEDIDPILRAMTCFNQSSINFVTAEDIGNTGPRVQLAHQHLIDSTVSVASSNLYRRVANELAIVQDGDYYIDLVNGMLYASTAPSPGSAVRYQYAEHDFTVYSSPVIIHDLQSENFQSKMFNGIPTALGAGIMNELLTIYPSTWGK